MEVTITAIKRTPRIAKSSGKPFVSLGIRTDAHGDKWLSGFGNDENADWEVGSQIAIEVEEKGEYLNFKPLGIQPPTQHKQTKAESSVSLADIKNAIILGVIPELKNIVKELIIMNERNNMPL